ncbi:MAG: methyl-accepting chemotaxis protein [Pseudomonadota bacterium]
MKLRIVMLLVIGPMFALAGYLMFSDISDQRADMKLASETNIRAKEGAATGALIHELQKERGYSAGYISSQGQNFPTQLRTQRRNTSSAIDLFLSDVTVLTQDHADVARSISERLAEIPRARQNVDSFSTTVPEMAKFYTDTINLLIKMARPARANTKDSQLQTLLNARALVGSAKESAGLERAMGATGLGSSFTLSVHDRFVSLGGAQNALMEETAGVLADPEWLVDLRESPEFKAVAAARKVVSTGYGTDDFQGLTASDWFKISTAWVDLLREKELELSNAVGTFAASIEANASSSFKQILWAGTSIILLVLVFAVFSFQRMITRIKNLIDVIDRFTQGQFDVYIDGIEGRDEISKMAAATYRFKQDTLEMRSGAEALQVEQERIRAEQDHVVKELRNGLEKLSNGDLTHEFTEPFPDEYENLRSDFNSTVSKLNSTLGEVVDATSSIRSGSNELAQSSEQLSQRTAGQAATLEETAAALEQITSSVRSAADGARDVQKTTESAKTEATESGTVVTQAVDAMSEITHSSEQISKIIGVIDDIAFQTNLLALNAGVEAARAGEAGRGFAVVASEVRALAQRSSEAALEIKTLIGESSLHVSSGVDLVNKAGDALEVIVQRVSDISNLVAEMAEATNEQALGLGEINTGVAQLDAVTQRNASMVQEANETCEELNQFANVMDGLVGQFQISKSNVTTATRKLSAA